MSAKKYPIKKNIIIKINLSMCNDIIIKMKRGLGHYCPNPFFIFIILSSQMLKLIFLIIFFFIGYFLADTKIIEIPFREMPYLENFYKFVE